MLNTARLWIGSAWSQAPLNNGGNLVFGSFPYQSGSINTDSHSFNIPLSSLVAMKGLTSADELCGQSFVVVAHAEVNNGSSTEGAFAEGTRISSKNGNRGQYFTITFSCTADAPVTARTCETGFAFGDTELDDIMVTNKRGELVNLTERWGWQITVAPSATPTVRDIYAGAGQNDLSKGVKVGTLTVEYPVGGPLKATYKMDSGFSMDEAHLYVGSTSTTTAAPGQFTYVAEGLNGATEKTFTHAISSDPAYVVAHAVACK